MPLIRHEQFRDDYAGGCVLPDGPRHGPYRLASITPDVYETLSGQKGVRIAREWADLLGDVPPALETDLQRELGDEAIHDWGVCTTASTSSCSFVLIDRSAGRITLLVAADD